MPHTVKMLYFHNTFEYVQKLGSFLKCLHVLRHWYSVIFGTHCQSTFSFSLSVVSYIYVYLLSSWFKLMDACVASMDG